MKIKQIKEIRLKDSVPCNTVIDSINGTNQKKYLEVGKRASEDIDAYLNEEKILFKIQRFGLGRDTGYHVTPV